MNTFTLASPVGFWSVSTTDTQIFAVDYWGVEYPTDRKPQTSLELQVESLLKQYFKGERVDFSGLPIQYPISPNPASSNLTSTVMARLLQVPYGEVYSYQWMAEQLGMPQGSRAVGNALGRNPIPIIVPCHRIVAKHGRLGGFMRGFSEGGNIKTFLLELEGHHFDGDKMIQPEQERLPLFV